MENLKRITAFDEYYDDYVPFKEFVESLLKSVPDEFRTNARVYVNDCNIEVIYDRPYTETEKTEQTTREQLQAQQVRANELHQLRTLIQKYGIHGDRV